MTKKSGKTIQIIINKDLIDEYGKYYFAQHPRANNHPLARIGAKDKTVGSVFPPSLNEMTDNPNRMVQNGVKQKWKDFVWWVCYKNNMLDWKLERASISYKWVFPDNRRRDLDNLIMHVKMLNDGFTNAGVWVDDCLGKIELHLDTNWYVEKGNPQIIIEIEELL